MFARWPPGKHYKVQINVIRAMRIYCLILLFISASTANGQSILELLRQAEDNYPLLKAKRYELSAAQSNVTSTKASIAPTLDASYQVNQATHNNITGMASPQFFIPISGPPSETNTSDAVFGSSASLLLNWDAFTFGQRSAQTDLAKATSESIEADAEYEIFTHKIKVVDTYLDLLLAHELLNVYKKNLDRSRENVRVIQTLTRAGLRPGVDTALFNAELSRAKIELLNYQNYLEGRKIAFNELLASDDVSYNPDSSFFHQLPTPLTSMAPIDHPLVLLSKSKVEIEKQKRKAVVRSLNPKLSLWGTAYARGSGVGYDGFVNSEEGLRFSRYNYGVGFQLSAPLLKFIHVRAELAEQNSLISAQEARYQHANLTLSKEGKIAKLALSNALDVAHESPTLYNAAKFSYDALSSRYSAGLTNYADLIQAQYSLLKAESDLKKSYLEAWKAFLYMAAIQGDLNLFLDQVESK
jgi:outer membrane protein